MKSFFTKSRVIGAVLFILLANAATTVQLFAIPSGGGANFGGYFELSFPVRMFMKFIEAFNVILLGN
ncbi:MAG: hypothetical protein AAF975_01020 [Spirochaetota bacterium]